MHELFINASIPPQTISQALQVLQGYTHMTPVHTYQRKITFKGPPPSRHASDTPLNGAPFPGLPKDLLRPRKEERDLQVRRNGEAWRELDERIRKGSYWIPVVWGVGDASMGENLNVQDLNARPGVLRFVEKPDAFGDPIVSRYFIEVRNELYLARILESCGYSPASNLYAEIWQCFHNNMHFELTRIIPNPANSSLNIDELKSEQNGKAYGNMWLLSVKVEIADGSKPDQMNQARQLLLKVVADLGDFFRFEQVDQKAFDTRARHAPV